MADVIQLLPEAIANQIAAGEVIQRPASVVKELIENSIDAGSTEIKMIIKDAGKALIQIIDDGCGMSEMDARLSFARHATSKLRAAEDLFTLRTMGFRGEALASIAAVAQVELKTRLHAEPLGVRIQVEGSDLVRQEPCQTSPGTSISVKNLFFNVPARRNFLKSNPVELKHILDEFHRIAFANPDVFFLAYHNGEEIYHLPPGNLRQRIIGVLGTQANKKLVPVTEETNVLRIKGFIGKPEYHRKTRGDQFFFVNNRFIKSAYLHHAVMSAYEELIPKNTYPLYIIFIDIDPARLDINVHPTKQEIKFDDERLVYNYLRVAVRHALGQHNITPTLDFEQETSFNSITPFPKREPKADDFETSATSSGPKPADSLFAAPESRHQSNLRNWQKLYEGLGGSSEEDAVFGQTEGGNTQENTLTLESSFSSTEEDVPEPLNDRKEPYQVHNTYIITQIKSGFIIIDQQAAHERILFEYYLKVLNAQTAVTQHQLFPKTLYLDPADASLLKEILPQITPLGFDIQEFGNNDFVINGVPADVSGTQNEEELISDFLRQYKDGLELRLDLRENLCRSLAKSAALKKGKSLTVTEMQTLIDKLFACEVPYKSPSGRNCILTFDLNELAMRFDS